MLDTHKLNDYCQDQLNGVYFTKENAKEMALKSVQSRAERKRAGDEAIEIVKALPPTANEIRAQRLGKQLDAIERMMERETESKELANLTAAHERIFRAWKDLTGLQSPGVRKVTKRRESSNVQPLPQPEVSRNTDSTPTIGPRSEDCNG